MGCTATIEAQWRASLNWPGTVFALCIKVTGQISQIGWRVDMNRQESSDSNPNPNTREDDEQKAKANRAVAETSRASAEVRQERAEQERIASEDSHQVAELDSCAQVGAGS